MHGHHPRLHAALMSQPPASSGCGGAASPHSFHVVMTVSFWNGGAFFFSLLHPLLFCCFFFFFFFRLSPLRFLLKASAHTFSAFCFLRPPFLGCGGSSAVALCRPFPTRWHATAVCLCLRGVLVPRCPHATLARTRKRAPLCLRGHTRPASAESSLLQRARVTVIFFARSRCWSPPISGFFSFGSLDLAQFAIWCGSVGCPHSRDGR